MLAFFRKLAFRRRLEREMADELDFHVQARAADLVRSGLTNAEAQRRARIEFGGVDRFKEELREGRRFGWCEDFVHDLAYAARSLRRSPVFALTAAGAIALGIGLNAALFSLVYGVLFRPIPVPDPGNVRDIYLTLKNVTSRKSFESQNFFSWAEFSYLRAHSHTAELAGISESQLTAPFAPAGLSAQLVSSNLLSLCGATPALGRLFLPTDDAKANAGAVAVLSYDAWQKYFNGADIGGRPILLNHTAFTVVGVANRGFYGPKLLRADVWIPLTMQPITRPGDSLITDPNAGFIQALARRKPGQSDSKIGADLQVLAQQAIADHQPTARAGIVVSPTAFLNYPSLLSEGIPILAILFLTVSLVLIAACANVANMLVARGFARAREIAIRLSMGAGRWRLVRQLLTEYILLGLLGGAAGLAMAQVATRGIMAAIPGLPEHQLDLTPDLAIAAWTLLLAVLAGVTFGLPSALGMVRSDLARAARGDAFETGVRTRRFRLQTVLTATQVAISALLLVNAGLLARAATSAIHFDPGHAVTGVLAVRPNLRELQYTPDRAQRYFREVRDRAAALPGVTGVSWTGFEPIRARCGTMAQAIQADGTPSQPIRAACNEIGEGYFQVMGIRLLAGRAFQPEDEAAAAKTVIVDDTYARRYLSGRALGRRIRTGGPESESTVIGVVASTRNLMAMAGDYPEIYMPLTGLRFLEGWLVISYRGPSEPVVQALRTLPPMIDRETTLTVRTIEESVSVALAVVRIAAGAVAALGILALILASTGVYGVVAFTVGRRRREIGIRLALGAEAKAVVRLLIWQSLRPVLIGGALGAAVAVAVAQLIRGMLYGVSPVDPLGLFGSLVLLAAVAIAAALLPASAALRVDPASSLRDQ